jgi:hypothetical protein
MKIMQAWYLTAAATVVTLAGATPWCAQQLRPYSPPSPSTSIARIESLRCILPARRRLGRTEFRVHQRLDARPEELDRAKELPLWRVTDVHLEAVAHVAKAPV